MLIATLGGRVVSVLLKIIEHELGLAISGVPPKRFPEVLFILCNSGYKQITP